MSERELHFHFHLWPQKLQDHLVKPFSLTPLSETNLHVTRLSETNLHITRLSVMPLSETNLRETPHKTTFRNASFNQIL